MHPPRDAASTPLRHDLDRFDALLDRARAVASEYLAAIAERPTGMPTPDTEIARTLSDRGVGALAALEEFRTRLQPLLVASTGPRYFGYVTGGTTPAALVGDWLAAAHDQNPQSSTGPGDVSALVELETIALLRDLLGLPGDLDGGFVSGATMANFTGLAVGRQWAAARLGVDAARQGVPPGIRVLAAAPHSSSLKSLAMLGLGSGNLVRVPAQPGREAIDLVALERELAEGGGAPAILIASGGTANTGDFDDLDAIAALRERTPFWWHVDAAFGGFAACSPDLRARLGAWQRADSVALDGHKWLNVPYDSGIWFVRREHATLQVQTFQNSNAPYLGDPSRSFNYLNLGPDNSRRLRALPAWFTLVAYGREGYREIVERDVRLARRLGERLDASSGFELAAPVRFNVVCFTPRGEMDDGERSRRVAEIVRRLCERGVVFLTPTTWAGRACLRAALVNWRTTEADVDRTVDELEEVGQWVSGA